MLHVPFSLVINRLAVTAWVLLCIALSFMDLSFISDSMGTDSEHLLNITYGGETDGIEGAYGATAKIFRLIPEVLLNPVVLAISCFALVLFMKDFRRYRTIAMAMYITLPAMLLFMTRPQKETIVICLTIITFFIFRSRLSEMKKILLMTALYGAYAYFIREYYFIIIVFFFGLYFMKKMHGMIRLAIIPISLAALALLPSDIFLETQGMRDFVNYWLGTDKRVIRTAFVNPYPADNAWHFILNYGYAALRLHLPIFFMAPTYKEVLHIASVWLFIWFIWIGMNARKDITGAGKKRESLGNNAILSSQLALAHVLTLLIFEPDLGSYLRHLTSIFLYLTPSMLLYDTGKHRKIRIVTS